MTRPLLPTLLTLAILTPLSTAQEAPPSSPALRVTGIGKAPPGREGTAQGRLLAEQAARTAAIRNLAAAVTGYLQPRDREETQLVVDAYIKGFFVTRTVHHPDGRVEVEVALPLDQVAANFRTSIADARYLRDELKRIHEEQEKMRLLLEVTQQRLDAIRRIVAGG